MHNFERAQVQIKTAARTVVTPMRPQHTAVAARHTLHRQVSEGKRA